MLRAIGVASRPGNGGGALREAAAKRDKVSATDRAEVETLALEGSGWKFACSFV